MSYTLHRGAELDLDEACRRYRSRASGRVVSRFLDEFNRVASVLAKDPGLGTPTGDDRASFPMYGFPYSVIYKSTGPGVRVLVVRHQHRNPEHGESRR